jgi:microcystin-dependent protein
VQLDGTNASASNPIFVCVPQGVPADGTYTIRTVTAALSLVISFGSTLGHTSARAGPVHVYLLDNSGTIELAAGSPEVTPYGIVSTTTEGGAGGADSFTTIYSTTGRASVPIVPLVRWMSTQTTAGSWASTAGEKLLSPWSSYVPAGTLLDFAGSNLPAGFLQCDGSAVSRTTYAGLFGAVSTAWGVGDGSTTFNIPDFRRRVAVGSGGSGTTTLSNAIGATGGAETHTLVTAELAAHTHTPQRFSSSSGGTNNIDATNDFTGTLTSLGSTTTSTGGGGSHNNIQPSAVVLKIIKT